MEAWSPGHFSSASRYPGHQHGRRDRCGTRGRPVSRCVSCARDAARLRRAGRDRLRRRRARPRWSESPGWRRSSTRAGSPRRGGGSGGSRSRPPCWRLSGSSRPRRSRAPRRTRCSTFRGSSRCSSARSSHRPTRPPSSQRFGSRTSAQRIARTLEAETGLNDPVAIALTIGLISWIEDPTFGVPATSCSLVLRQLALGLWSAWCSARRDVGVRRLPNSIGAFAPVASVATAALTFGLADIIHGSGFLVVYLVGLAVGSTPSRYRSQLVAFHEGLAFLAQVAMFIVLGLLVFPAICPRSPCPGLALALLLVVVIRPAAVWISTRVQQLHGTRASAARLGRTSRRRPDRPRDLRPLGPAGRAERRSSTRCSSSSSSRRSCRAPPSSGSPSGSSSSTRGRRGSRPPLEVDALGSLELVEFNVAGDHAISGAVVRELGLPRTALVAVVARGHERFRRGRAR